ncbi:branched-chain amino acid ABC transporter permease [Spirochaeta cellobiosiphila]|uniref:branched-chain amino acid ABC transporter permease n=1 Tax=Spirochaeta cellobiosiphila TaxID=504483 RepID=UPI00048AA046|nr:branched-chain amino acid ABC transporter permease [Spirochaeta cellobiosiphila]
MVLIREILQQMVNGLALGSIYALIALGYTMVYGIIMLINFAHGEILMLGAFYGYFILTWLGVSPLTLVIAFVVSMVLSAITGVIVERLFYKPLRNMPRINSLITAIGVSLFLQNGARVLPALGPNPRPFPTIDAKSHFIGGVGISDIQIMIIVISILLMFLLTWIVDHTKPGKAMRAVSYDQDASALMGISVNRTISITFAIGSALAAAAGILYALAYPQIDPYMGVMPGLKAFVAAVLGGIGSIPGAMIGGLVMGLAETFTKGFINSQLADAVVFGLLIVILLIKPTGIMGKNIKEKV